MAEMLQLHMRYGGTEAVVEGGHLVLQGEREWLLTGPADGVDAATARLPGIAERIAPGVALLAFGNAVGFFDLPGLGRLEVRSGKWGAAAFDRMLAELTDIAAGLPFAAGDTAALPYDRSVAARQDVLYHMFVYLRYVLSEACPPDERLLSALRLIAQQPHERIERDRRMVRFEEARHVDARSLESVLTGRGEVMAVGDGVRARIPLAGTLRGHLPQRIDESSVRIVRDTPENRFVKAFVGSAAGIAAQMAAATRRRRPQTAFTRRLLDECATMAQQLRPIEQHSLWREVGPMVHVPTSSPVLQRLRGYKGVLRHFARLRLAARVPLDPTVVQDLLEAKDIAHLYEIWSYFTLVALVGTMRGKPVSARGTESDEWQHIVRWDLRTEWTDGTALFYNPRFSRSQPPGRRSYSVSLRPDIALEVPTGPNKGLHLFDAKFKVEHLASLLPVDANADDTAEEKAEERLGKHKRGDLHKMHTYRDAIAGARSVWILYPGTETRFYNATPASANSSADPLPFIFDGVGAVPLQPGESTCDDLMLVLRRLLN